MLSKQCKTQTKYKIVFGIIYQVLGLSKPPAAAEDSQQLQKRGEAQNPAKPTKHNRPPPLMDLLTRNAEARLRRSGATDRAFTAVSTHSRAQHTVSTNPATSLRGRSASNLS